MPVSKANSIPADAAAKGTVLVVLSSADFIKLENNKDQETGYFLSELAKPLMKLLEAGYSVEFANPKGNAPAMDPLSDNAIWFFGNWKEKNREKELLERMGVEANFRKPRPFSSLTDADLARYAGVFIPGGHAPMTDLSDDPNLGRILRYFHQAGKPTASLCHGPIALLSAKSGDNDWAYRGYKVTCYSDTEEKTNELMWGSHLSMEKAQSALSKAGAELVTAMPMLKKVTIDRELITGQNPSSAYGVGEALVEALDRKTVAA